MVSFCMPFTETLSADSEKRFPCFWGLFLQRISSSALKHLDTGYHVKDREKAGRQKTIIILLKHLSRATLDMQVRRMGGGGGGGGGMEGFERTPFDV